MIKDFIFVLLIWLLPPLAQAASAIDPPIFANVSIDSDVRVDASTGMYKYSYTITNPATNTAKIISIHLDITRTQQSQMFDTNEVAVTQMQKSFTFEQILSRKINPVLMTPVGITAPQGWWATIGGRGFAAFNVIGVGDEIYPGGVSPPFQLSSRGIPSIRDVEFLPAWIYVSTRVGGISEQESEEAKILTDSLRPKARTIGPSAITVGSVGHWDQIRDDINEAGSLGWIADNTIYTDMATRLANARSAYLSRDVGSTPDGTLSKEILNSILTLLLTATPGQISPSTNYMFRINIELLIPTIPDTPPPPIPFEAAYSLQPETATNDVGTTYTLIAKVFNKAHNNDSVEGFPVYMYVVTGPHNGENWWGYTDANGEFAASYVGTQPGTDHILWENADAKLNDPMKKVLVASSFLLPAMLEGSALYPYVLGQARVTWENGADLTVPLFAPPEIHTKGGNKVTVTDITKNIGLSVAAASTTRYYLAETLPFNVANARVIGERRIPVLGSNQETDASTLDYTIPNDLPQGIYYMAACADADNEIVELNEFNNCSFNEIDNHASLVVGIIPDTNNPPICDTAKPNKTILWPPNHKLQKITITGVTNPGDDSSDDSSSSYDSSGGTSSSHDSSSGSSSSHSSSSSHDSSSGSSSSHDSSSSSSGDSKDNSDDDSSSSSDDSDNESGDDITIKITSIQQDEPVNGLGDGDTSPDGFGVGTSTAKVRAERSGLENGRIYIIGFEATNEAGASCTGGVTVGVPHDKKSTPIDSGARYDSTLQ